MKVLVVAKTRMRDRVCVGGHELDTFRSLRLMGSDGRNMPTDTPLDVGHIWNLEFMASEHVTPPHIEDVLLQRGSHVDEIKGLCRYLTERAEPWTGGPAVLFGGCLETSATGRAFVPLGGPLPDRSTGYWLPDAPLRKEVYGDSISYRCAQGSELRMIRYAGVAEGPEVVRVGDLVRVSLSRRFESSAGDEGFWLQLSCVFPR